MEENKRKRGRPCKNVSKIRQYKIRMTEDEFEELARLSRITGKSKADIIRDGINHVKTDIKNDRAAKFPNIFGRTEDDEYGYYEEYDDEFYDEYE